MNTDYLVGNPGTSYANDAKRSNDVGIAKPMPKFNDQQIKCIEGFLGAVDGLNAEAVVAVIREIRTELSQRHSSRLMSIKKEAEHWDNELQIINSI